MNKLEKINSIDLIKNYRFTQIKEEETGFLTKLRSTSSGTLLDELQRALAALWENITGALLIANASLIVLIETWDKSTSIPNRFNSFTTALPNADNPSLWKSNRASEFESSTEQESALRTIATTVVRRYLFMYLYEGRHTLIVFILLSRSIFILVCYNVDTENKM